MILSLTRFSNSVSAQLQANSMLSLTCCTQSIPTTQQIVCGKLMAYSKAKRDMSIFFD